MAEIKVFPKAVLPEAGLGPFLSAPSDSCHGSCPSGPAAPVCGPGTERWFQPRFHSAP